jgi:hypothetical protein
MVDAGVVDQADDKENEKNEKQKGDISKEV